MDDLISRQDALKALDEMSYKSPHESATSVVRKKHFGEILEKFIMQQPSAQQWIPCSERLPEEFKGVLCCTDMREMFLARVYIFDDGNYSFNGEDGMMWEGNVVAWMPLPEPYKGDEDYG